MVKTFKRVRVAVAGALIVILGSFFLAQDAFAGGDCGNVIYVRGGVEYSQPIDDCGFTFGPINTNESLQVSFNGTVIEDGGVYPLAGSYGSMDVPGLPPFAFSTLFKHQADDYRIIAQQNQSFTFATGTYSLYISEEEAPILIQSLPQKIQSFFIPTVYAAPGNYTLITFEITDPLPPEPDPVDPLILQYAPILYFHPYEDYFPMNVEAFVDASSLWSQSGLGDTLIRNSTDLTFAEFESIVSSTEDTSDYYLAYSEPDNAKSFDLDNARTTYKNQVTSGEAISNTYYRKMTDRTDDEREFTVLQYWYFYGMNNWGEEGGRNDHEGDWESVFIYLDEDTDNPKYVAYSAHLNDGENEVLNLFQYDSVRRAWDSDEVVYDDDRIVSFVSLGSHANYSNNNDNGEHNVGSKVDKTSTEGPLLSIENFSNLDDDEPWTQYQGKWGADTYSLGGDGPQGPRFINVTGQTRFENPLEWAGIDKIQEQVILEPVTTVPFDNSDILLEFSSPVPSGTSISVSPYYEPITFGVVPNNATMLPGYYDLTSNMDNGTFEVLMTLPYDLQYIESIGGTTENIRIGYYNEPIDTWEILPTILNEQNNSVSTTRTGFSRYALMLIESEDIADIQEEIATTTQTMRTNQQGTRIDRVPEPEVLGVSVSVVSLQQVMVSLDPLIQRYPQMTYAQKQTLLRILEEVLRLLRSR